MPTADAIGWFKGHFETRLLSAVANTPFSTDFVVAVACQETGYLWNTLRRHLPLDRVLALSVGDTIDFKPPDAGRRAFPRDRAALLAAPSGADMFAIARTALLELSEYVTDYRGAAANPLKFCRGFGIFQYDLQHFTDDATFFLERQWHDFDACLARCLRELAKAQVRARLGGRTTLSDLEQCHVAIAYNRGSFASARGLAQGYRSGGRYYGEWIAHFLRLAQATPAAETGRVLAPTATGRTVLPPPTPPSASGRTWRVDVQTEPLRLRSRPIIPANPTSNVIARLPDGQVVRAVDDRAVDDFLEIETTLAGALLRGWVSTRYLIPAPGPDLSAVAQPAAPSERPDIAPVSAPRRPGRVTRRQDPADAHSLDEPGQPGRRGRTPAELCDELHAIIAWLDVEAPAHARYQPRDGHTFCNVYAHDYCHLAGVYLPRVWWTGASLAALGRGEAVVPRVGVTVEEQRANALFGWLRDFGLDYGWRRTGTLGKLQDAANQGAVALILARRQHEGPPGHVSVVAPESPRFPARRDARGEVTAPVQSQAGARNLRLSTAPGAWWRNARFAENAFWIHP